MQGVARSVALRQEKSRSVLSMLLECNDGETRTVELRGLEISGLVFDGNVIVLDPQARQRDGIFHPLSLRNQTLGTWVRASNPKRFGKFAMYFGNILLSAIVSALVGFGVKGLTGATGPGYDTLMMSLLALVCSVGAAISFRRERRARMAGVPVDRVRWPLSLGAAIGFALVALLTP